MKHQWYLLPSESNLEELGFQLTSERFRHLLYKMEKHYWPLPKRTRGSGHAFTWFLKETRSCWLPEYGLLRKGRDLKARRQARCGMKRSLVKCQATAWISECDLSTEAWPATRVFGKWWGLQPTVLLHWLLHMLKNFSEKPKVTSSLLLSDEKRSLLRDPGFGRLGFEGRWETLKGSLCTRQLLSKHLGLWPTDLGNQLSTRSCHSSDR